MLSGVEVIHLNGQWMLKFFGYVWQKIEQNLFFLKLRVNEFAINHLFVCCNIVSISSLNLL
jgi:hypothetical protein